MVGNGGGDRWSGWRLVIHGSWIMGLVGGGGGDGDGDGWVFLGFSGGGLWPWRSVWP